MRRLTKQEVYKRGCEYCMYQAKIGADRKYIVYLASQRKAQTAKARRELRIEKLSYGFCCKFDTCPYRELDKYASYKEYLRHKEGII